MKLYAIARVDKKRTIDIQGIKIDIELSWIDGQIGAMPVFDDLEKAYLYAKENGYEVIEYEMV